MELDQRRVWKAHDGILLFHAEFELPSLLMKNRGFLLTYRKSSEPFGIGLTTTIMKTFNACVRHLRATCALFIVIASCT